MIEILFYDTDGGQCPVQDYQGSDITRVFYFFFHKNKVILTNGFTKKSQKTPVSEIRRAKKYKVDYERRHAIE